MERVGLQIAPVCEPLASPGTRVRRVSGAAIVVARAIRRALEHARGEHITEYPELLHATDRDLTRFAARYGRHDSPVSALRDSIIGYR
jgi:hypothetical protein